MHVVLSHPTVKISATVIVVVVTTPGYFFVVAAFLSPLFDHVYLGYRVKIKRASVDSSCI